MKPWRILSKHVKRVDADDADSVELHLICERDGVQRDAVVSGRTFDEKREGDTVELIEHERRVAP
ncbi:MAG: hypothetical protein KGI71_04965 [Patescibacteria group bacterium]|nr:hypothetical protein [Patescibacteria group bacterium]